MNKFMNKYGKTAVACLISLVVGIGIGIVVTSHTAHDNKPTSTKNSSQALSSTEDSNKNNTIDSSALNIEINKPFQVKDEAEFTLESFKFEKVAKPTNASEYYSYYEADKGMVYADVSAVVKNLHSGNKEISKIVDVDIIYDHNYHYSAFCVGDIRGDFDTFPYGNPLNPVKVRFLAKVPEEMVNSTKPIEVIVKIGDKTFVYNYRK